MVVVMNLSAVVHSMPIVSSFLPIVSNFLRVVPYVSISSVSGGKR
jgi:hypothetical protein